LYQWLSGKLEIAHGENTPLRSMEGLRGVAVFLVFWVHYSSLIEPWLLGQSIQVAHFIHSFGHLGVDLFFVLSGYLIYGSIISKQTFVIGTYAKRRIQRIYPTFLVVFVIYLALSFMLPAQSKLPEGIWQQAWYIGQNLLLLPGIFDIEPIITVAWSLSYEVFYYLLIPIVIFGLRLKSWSAENRIILWISVAVLGFIAGYFWEGPIRLLMFISGVLLFELHSQQRWTFTKGGTRILLISLFGFAIARTYGIDYIVCMAMVFVAFTLLGLCAFNSNSYVAKWLTFTPLRWLGNMSYSYYLLHGLTLKFCFLIFAHFIPPTVPFDSLYYWLWLPFFILTLLSSFILFIQIERPWSLAIKHAR